MLFEWSSLLPRRHVHIAEGQSSSVKMDVQKVWRNFGRGVGQAISTCSSVEASGRDANWFPGRCFSSRS